MNTFTSARTGISLILLTLCCVPALAQDIQWQSDVQAAIKQAAAEKKLVLLHFSATWCRPCQSLEKFVFRSLDVARAFEANVVAVEIDVDQEQSIVTEYGVNAVPYDVVITPGGRVITKRKSPLDTRGYLRMLASLSQPVKDLEDSKTPSLQEQLQEFKGQFDYKPSKLAEFQNFTPNAPSHTAPVSSSDSAELARKARVTNPFFAAAHENSLQQEKNTIALAANPPKPPAMTESSTVGNSFVPKASSPAKLSDTSFHGNAFSLSSAPKQTLQPKVEPQLNKAIQVANPQKTKIAKAVAPAKIQNDRFFKDPVKVGPVEKTRLVAPSQTAQKLLEPIKQNANRKVLKQDSVALARKVADAKSSTNENDFLARALEPKPASPQPLAPTLIKPSIKADQLMETQPAPKNMSQATTPAARATATPQIGLAGKCPVSLLQKRQWIPGDQKFGCVHRDRLYIFADAAKQRMFQADPDFYSPILAGYDPVTFHDTGKLVDGKEQHGVFMGKAPNQRIVLFSDAASRARFQKNPEQYLATVRQAMSTIGGSSSPMLR